MLENSAITGYSSMIPVEIRMTRKENNKKTFILGNICRKKLPSTRFICTSTRPLFAYLSKDGQLKNRKRKKKWNKSNLQIKQQLFQIKLVSHNARLGLQRSGWSRHFGNRRRGRGSRNRRRRRIRGASHCPVKKPFLLHSTVTLNRSRK